MNRLFLSAIVLFLSVQVSALSIAVNPTSGDQVVDRLLDQTIVSVNHTKRLNVSVAQVNVQNNFAAQKFEKFEVELTRYHLKAYVSLETLINQKQRDCGKLLMSETVIRGKDSVVFKINKPVRTLSYQSNGYLYLDQPSIVSCERVAGSNIEKKHSVVIDVDNLMTRVRPRLRTNFVAEDSTIVVSGAGMPFKAKYSVEFNSKNIQCASAAKQAKNENGFLVVALKNPESHVPQSITESDIASCRFVKNPFVLPVTPVCPPPPPRPPVGPACILAKPISLENSPSAIRTVAESDCEGRAVILTQSVPQGAWHQIGKDYVTFYKDLQGQEPVLRVAYFPSNPSDIAKVEVLRGSSWVSLSPQFVAKVFVDQKYNTVVIKVSYEFFIAAGVQPPAGLYMSTYAPILIQ